MRTSPILRIVLVLLGVVALIFGAYIGIYQIKFIFSKEGIQTYATIYPNSLSGAAQELGILLTNIWLAMTGIVGGLLYIIPVKMGRWVRAAGYITPNAEVIPKAYRAGGIYMIVGSVLSIIARLLFSKAAKEDYLIIMILPLLMLVIGIIGLIPSLTKPK